MTRFVMGATGRLAYDTRESPEPTLLPVHGNSSHKGLWRPLLSAIAERGVPPSDAPLLHHLPGRRAICLDLRGHGESGWARPPAYTDTDYADDIRRTIQALGLQDFILVGHSNGGRASLHYAAHNHPKPRALIYMDMDPSIPGWQVDYFRQRARAVAEKMAQTAPQGRYREIEGAGHFLVLGKPEAAAEAIEEFLRECGLT